MLDMGFLPDIRKIIALLPAKRQNLLFSATFSTEIRALSGSVLSDPATVEVAPRNTTARRGPAARLPGRSRPQAKPAGPPRPQARPAPGARLHAHQAWPHAAGRLARPRGHRRRRHPPRPHPARARDGARGGSRRARSGCWSPPTSRPAGSTSRTCRRRELRAAVEPAGLHPPHRPDRPGGHDGRGHLARLHRRGRPAARRPADAQAGDPVDGRGGLHPRSRHASRDRSGRGRVTLGSARSTTRIASRVRQRRARVPGG